MCRISRHTTLLLSGIASLESRVVEMANQGASLLFIGAENLANLACRSCSIPCIKPLPTIVKVVEGCVIFNFALDHKVHFSLKIQRKSNLKPTSVKCKRPGTPRRALLRHRARPRRPPVVRAVPRRARTPRHRSDHRSLRSAGGDSPVPSVASGPRQVVLIHRPAHRPWRAISRRSGARRRPCPGLSTRASGTGVTPPTPNQPPARL
jgi:hypothetical protein